MGISAPNRVRELARIDIPIHDIAPAADMITPMWTGCRQVPAATADRLGPVTTDGF